MTQGVLVVIPVREHSERLPGKPLRVVGAKGLTLIEVIVHQVVALVDLLPVVVATDSVEVEAVLQGIVPCYMTSSECRNGTERVAEALFDRGDFGNIHTVVNVQGDQLFLPEQAIKGPLALVQHGLADVGTAVAPIDYDAKFNPNRVKALVQPITQRCVGFYRLATQADELCKDGPVVAEHIGVYVYNRENLRRWVNLPRSPLETALSLEQARPLEAGMVVKAAWTDRAPVVVDTEEDLNQIAERAEWHGLTSL